MLLARVYKKLPLSAQLQRDWSEVLCCSFHDNLSNVAGASVEDVVQLLVHKGLRHVYPSSHHYIALLKARKGIGNTNYTCMNQGFGKPGKFPLPPKILATLIIQGPELLLKIISESTSQTKKFLGRGSLIGHCLPPSKP